MTVTLEQKLQSKKPNNTRYIFILLGIFLFAFGWFGFNKLIDWFNNHEIVKQRLIKVETHWPLAIKQREVTKEATQSAIPKLETANEKIIRLVNEKFGDQANKTFLLLQGEQCSNEKKKKTCRWDPTVLLRKTFSL